ncbi:hypothetical protein [Dyadobacter sp. NIV53]|uniref:hypothetical protein n=1 Tax=Dyadobacter sp. NIV53 TaxID=2861765 RepID=UPI001C881701|nr:hypothetical protein [Dyadobacter sp. NIV53]
MDLYKTKNGNWSPCGSYPDRVSYFLANTNAQQRDRTWSVYKADANSSNYSPLDQINVSDF